MIDFDCSMFNSPILEFFRVDTLWVVDSAIPFLYTNADCTSTMEIPHSMQTDITESLEKRWFGFEN